MKTSDLSMKILKAEIFDEIQIHIIINEDDFANHITEVELEA